jgi:hypothetical protein
LSLHKLGGPAAAFISYGASGTGCLSPVRLDPALSRRGHGLPRAVRNAPVQACARARLPGWSNL